MNIERRFDFLDDLPDSLFETVVTTRHGSLRERVEGVLAWRAALLEGRLPMPDTLPWPDRTVSERLLPRLETLEMAPLCRDEKSLTDHLLKDICRAVDSVDEWREQGLDGLFDDELARERHRGRETRDTQGPESNSAPRSEAGGASGMVTAPPSEGTENQTQGSESNCALQPGSSDENQGNLTPADPAQMADTASMLPDQELDDLQTQWQRLQNDWREISALATDLGTRMGRGWDLSTGLLQQTDWRELVPLRRWLRNHPQLLEIVARLGREQSRRETGADDDESPGTGEGEAPQAVVPVPRTIRSEDPMSTRGLVHSDDIARMLPREAGYLGHPGLHMLWHAKRAERALLCYRVEGVLSEHQPELPEVSGTTVPASPAGSPEKGPLLICLDTSASMHGEPERLAKALCLEVLRLANRERRQALLFAFSGPGQLLQERLQFSPDGLRRLVRFLQRTFQGGTDIRLPLERALAQVEQAGWEKSDMLLVSDGRFPVPDDLARRVERVREQGGLRIQGVRVGRWNSRGMARICQQLYSFPPAP